LQQMYDTFCENQPQQRRAVIADILAVREKLSPSRSTTPEQRRAVIADILAVHEKLSPSRSTTPSPSPPNPGAETAAKSKVQTSGQTAMSYPSYPTLPPGMSYPTQPYYIRMGDYVTTRQ
jgi:hypothetical protein